MPAPINALRTRVVQMTSGSYVIQASSDGLTWGDVDYETDQTIAECSAEDMQLHASLTPAKGEVVWPKP